MIRKVVAGLLSIFALFAIFLFPADHPFVRPIHAQTACPSEIYVGSYNATLSIDSSVAVWTSGCPTGTTITYYITIPSSPAHPCGGSGEPPCFHPYVTATNPISWVDVTRNEQVPTEFPNGYYSFWACSGTPYNQCIQSAEFDLETPAGAAGGYFNPWGPYTPAGANMQWNRNLCELYTNCVTGTEHELGEELDFYAYNDNNQADGDNLLQNLNAFFTYPNPGDPQDGFTQLTILHQNGYVTPYFYEFTSDIDYCAGVPQSTVSNLHNSCLENFPADGQPHLFQDDIWPAQCCQDTMFQCLKVYYDGNYFAEERMQGGGGMHSAFVQNESYTSPNSAVWGAQLNYWDYSESGRVGSLNQNVRADYAYNYMQYLSGQGWGQFSWNSDAMYDDYVRSIRNFENSYATDSVYCGPFSQSYWPDGNTPPNQSSAKWGTLDLHC